ncbi:MAG: hypothetical protein HQL38_17095 [Alphaproteobacteria bacterium]|nr:hypothetical protein [Alphaproteobacteria bacterium]MBF0394396.1 hypothetical protein [Alphaproteobacteria bacterium]
MPKLSSVLASPEELQASIDRMSQPEAVRQPVRLNHGIRSYQELAELVTREPFEDDDDLGSVYAGAIRMTSRDDR